MSRATDEMVYEALAPSGVPGTRHAWAEGTKPPLPWFTYRLTNGGEVHADSRNYAALPRYRAELHLAEADPELEEAFRDAVAAIGPYSYGEEYDEEDAALVMTYDFTVC